MEFTNSQIYNLCSNSFPSLGEILAKKSIEHVATFHNKVAENKIISNTFSIRDTSLSERKKWNYLPIAQHISNSYLTCSITIMK